MLNALKDSAFDIELSLVSILSLNMQNHSFVPLKKIQFFKKVQ